MSCIQQFSYLTKGRVYVVTVSKQARYFIGTQDLAPWCVHGTQELVVIGRYCHIRINLGFSFMI